MLLAQASEIKQLTEVVGLLSTSASLLLSLGLGALIVGLFRWMWRSWQADIKQRIDAVEIARSLATSLKDVNSGPEFASVAKNIEKAALYPLVKRVVELDWVERTSSWCVPGPGIASMTVLIVTPFAYVLLGESWIPGAGLIVSVVLLALQVVFVALAPNRPSKGDIASKVNALIS